jgi:hypothetical protein
VVGRVDAEGVGVGGTNKEHCRTRNPPPWLPLCVGLPSPPLRGGRDEKQIRQIGAPLSKLKRRFERLVHCPFMTVPLQFCDMPRSGCGVRLLVLRPAKGFPAPVE